MNIDLKELKTNKTLQKILALGLLIILVLVLCFNNVKQMSAQKNDIQNLSTEVSVLESRIKYLKSLAAKEDEFLSKLTALKAQLPEGVNQQELLRLFNNLGEEYHVDITQVSFDAPAVFLDFNSVGARIDITGDYAQTMNMMNSLTNDYRVMSLTNMTATGFNKGMVKLQATIAIYYR